MSMKCLKRVLLGIVCIASFALAYSGYQRGFFGEYSLYSMQAHYSARQDEMYIALADIFSTHPDIKCEFRGKQYSLRDCAAPYLRRFDAFIQPSLQDSPSSAVIPCEKRYFDDKYGTCKQLVLYAGLLRHPDVEKAVVDFLISGCGHCPNTPTVIDYVDEELSIEQTRIIYKTK